MAGKRAKRSAKAKAKPVRARAKTNPKIVLKPKRSRRTTQPRGVAVVTATSVETTTELAPVASARPSRGRAAEAIPEAPIARPARSRSKTIALPRKPGYERGQWVLFSTMPTWVSRLPQESQDVFAYCFGRKYRIEDITPDGMLVLDVSADVDHEFGGFMNDIRVEPECVVPAPT